MHYTYNTKGTCSTHIDFEINNNIITDVSFTKGCHGNLQAVSRLVDGKSVDEIAGLLTGIDCKGRGTSCGDQLAHAVKEAAKRLCRS